MFLATLTATVALLFGQPIGTVEPMEYTEAITGHATFEFEEFPVYPWGTITSGDGRILGQNISDFLIFGAGAGYKHELTDKLNLRVEVGGGYVWNDANEAIQQEVIYTYVTGNHAVYGNGGPPVNKDPACNNMCYGTTWDIGYSWILRFGFEYEVTDDISAFVNYRYFNPEGLLELYDPELKPSMQFWQEYRSINMSVVEFGVGWRF